MFVGVCAYLCLYVYMYILERIYLIQAFDVDMSIAPTMVNSCGRRGSRRGSKRAEDVNRKKRG